MGEQFRLGVQNLLSRRDVPEGHPRRDVLMHRLRRLEGGLGGEQVRGDRIVPGIRAPDIAI
ncbi:hypothetical protein [Arthrobacter sp. A5]|uniref:hypothetical protein n=1 Tax=Arthrobacter sp. A5 TaxID=576926 RepID=UPI003DA9F3D9